MLEVVVERLSLKDVKNKAKHQEQSKLPGGYRVLTGMIVEGKELAGASLAHSEDVAVGFTPNHWESTPPCIGVYQ